MSGRGKSRWNCNNDWVINWWLEIENPPSHQHDDKRKLAFCCCTTSPTPLTLVSHPLRFSFFFPFFFVKTEKFSLPTEEKFFSAKAKRKKLVNFSFFHNFSRFPSSTSTVNFSPFALLFLLTTARKARAAQIKLWEKRKFSHREKKSSGAPCWMRFRLVNDYEKWVFEWCCGRIELLLFVVRFASRLFMERFFPSFALSRKIFQRFFFFGRGGALWIMICCESGFWHGFLCVVYFRKCRLCAGNCLNGLRADDMNVTQTISENFLIFSHFFFYYGGMKFEMNVDAMGCEVKLLGASKEPSKCRLCSLAVDYRFGMRS